MERNNDAFADSTSPVLDMLKGKAVKPENKELKENRLLIKKEKKEKEKLEALQRVKEMYSTEKLAEKANNDIFYPNYKISTRLDKNLVVLIDQIESHYMRHSAKDRFMIYSLLAFFSYQEEYGLYGMGIVDPEVFSAFCGINATDLRRYNPNPYQYQQKQIIGPDVIKIQKEQERDYLSISTTELIKGGKVTQVVDKLWDSNLENALYILMADPIVFNPHTPGWTEGGSKDNNFTVRSTLKTMQFLTELECIAVRSKTRKGAVGGQTKFLYKYTLNTTFKQNLTSFYFNVFTDVFKILVQNKTTRLFGLYTFAMSRRGACAFKNTPTEIWTIDHLAKLALIKQNLTDEGRRNIELKRAVNKDLNSIKTLPGLEKMVFKWDKTTSTQRYKYNVIVEFTDIVILSPEAMRSVTEKEKHQRAQMYEKNMLYKGIVEIFNEGDEARLILNHEEKEKAFLSWILTQNDNKKVYALVVKWLKGNANSPVLPQTASYNMAALLVHISNKKSIDGFMLSKLGG